MTVLQILAKGEKRGRLNKVYVKWLMQIVGSCRGFTANLVRNSVISATEIVSYDSAKALLREALGMPDGIGLHFIAGLSAGLAATALGSPADVVGTRLMAQVCLTPPPPLFPQGQ